MAFTSSSVSSSSILLPCAPATACKNQQKPALAAFPIQGKKPQSRLVAVSAVGDVSADGTTYLIAGAIAVALVGTAFPILFSRKDTCPVCDGAGFVRKSGSALRANAARKDQAQIVCANCNGLGKLGQIDK
ncbi:hypothetical protein LUZ63_014458 [Rhynchospora breviuscula]|uniref:Uncharacterized protein n=1 Tax=Rhynchospora breviuscula TaxID=2022672 RepID=A0A9Q0CAH7_9POAL|nr:hypothetical protein LUZ63_014458 [Rhynchospora breviuscula]